MSDITKNSPLIPITAIVLGLSFLGVYAITSIDLFAAAAVIFIISGCTILTMHPFIGPDSKRQKVIESILGIIATCVIYKAVTQIETALWNDSLINLVAAIFILIGCLILSRNLLED